jgi:hypothetical protein
MSTQALLRASTMIKLQNLNVHNQRVTVPTLYTPRCRALMLHGSAAEPRPCSLDSTVQKKS